MTVTKAGRCRGQDSKRYQDNSSYTALTNNTTFNGRYNYAKTGITVYGDQNNTIDYSSTDSKTDTIEIKGGTEHVVANSLGGKVTVSGSCTTCDSTTPMSYDTIKTRAGL